MGTVRKCRHWNILSPRPNVAIGLLCIARNDDPRYIEAVRPVWKKQGRLNVLKTDQVKQAIELIEESESLLMVTQFIMAQDSTFQLAIASERLDR